MPTELDAKFISSAANAANARTAHVRVSRLCILPVGQPYRPDSTAVASSGSCPAYIEVMDSPGLRSTFPSGRLRGAAVAGREIG
jgi:hypothetical protein